MRVLIADPHPEVRGLLVRLVRHLGHEAEALATGGEGELPRGDALVVDPVEEAGLAVARALRARDPGLPVILVSGLAAGGEALALGPVAQLPKPFAIADLERALAAAAAALARVG